MNVNQLILFHFLVICHRLSIIRLNIPQCSSAVASSTAELRIPWAAHPTRQILSDKRKVRTLNILVNGTLSYQQLLLFKESYE